MAVVRRLGRDLPPYDEILYARVQIFRGDYADACKSADRALLKLAEPHGLWVRAKALSTKANALLFGGRLGDAHRTVTAGIELANKNENAPWLGILLSTLAWLRWEAFDFEGMEALSKDIEHSAQAASGPQMWRRATANVAGATLRLLTGFADLAAGRQDRALQSFTDIRDQNLRARFGLSWHRRMFAELGLSETWLAIGEFARARTEADLLVDDVTRYGDCYLKARAWEMRARLALASGRPESAERYLRRALDVITTFDVPLARWRVHATAWEVYRQLNSRDAELHRSSAHHAALDLAGSMADLEPLRERFLSAHPIRRVIERKGSGSVDEALPPTLVQQT
jgi:tetratricopeptide (TPR) repeat protein